MKRFIILAALLLAFPAQAQDQAVCGKRTDIAKHLAEKYGEHPTKQGVTSTGILLEWFESKNGETWTLIFSKADGTSCAIAAGTNSQSVKQDAPGTSL